MNGRLTISTLDTRYYAVLDPMTGDMTFWRLDDRAGMPERVSRIVHRPPAPASEPASRQ